MKLLSSFFLVTLLFSQLEAATSKVDEEWLRQQRAALPPGANIVLSMLEICVKNELGVTDQKAVSRRLMRLVVQAEQQIRQACQVKDIQKAHTIAKQYAATTEGKATMVCIQKLKPLIEQPSVQKLLGKHQPKARTILAGGIPANVCE